MRVGDFVKTRDQFADDESGTETGVVTQLFVRERPGTLLLQFDSGDSIETTPEHPFFLDEGDWVEAGDLQVGQTVANLAGEPVRISAIVRLSEPTTVYNFEVAGTHTYFVDAGEEVLWVHNDCTPAPNPGGRRGSPEHVRQVDEVEKSLQARVDNDGWEHVAGGSKKERLENGRYADLWYKDADGNNHFYQIGRTTKGGRPVARGVDAAGDLAESGFVYFVPF